MAITIVGTYPQSVKLGEKLTVRLRLTNGRAVAIRAWFDDVTETILSAPNGLESGELSIYLSPSVAGQQRLKASARDACDNYNQTGVPRLVTVTP